MKVLRCLPILFLILTLSCTGKPEPVPVSPPETFTREQWIRREARFRARSLTVYEQAAQVLMTGIDGKTTFPPHLWRHFKGIVPGAILLFGYNIADTPEQVHHFIGTCTDAFGTMGGEITPFFAIDHEGGIVNRLAGITAALPSAKRVAESVQPERAETLYYHCGVQLRSLGITMNLAPVAEVVNDGNESFLTSRSYGTDPDTVSRYVMAAVRGYRAADVLPVIKHYPGNSMADPHTGASTLAVSRELLETGYLSVFRTAFDSGAPAVLLSHVRVPSIDEENPFCLSPTGVTGLLRETESFSGLVVTDDISMGALSRDGSSSAEHAIRALRAGCDMIMTSDTDIARIVNGITGEAGKDTDFAQRLEDAVTKILTYKLESGLLYTAREKLARSRLGKPASFAVNPFNRTAFTDSGKIVTLILENQNE